MPDPKGANIQAPHDPLIHRPLILRSSLPADREKLAALKAEGAVLHDLLRPQLEELVRTLNPDRKFSPEELANAVADHVAGAPMEEYGVWVYYPWNHRLVHLLDEEEFKLVRTDRNRNKITRQEQQRLSELRIGIIGLSVGRSAALTIALERGCGELRLADHDTLDLSNLNRLAAGVHELGVNKAISCARQIAELDPYLRVTCYTQGITLTNIDRFFLENGRLDLVVEECDEVAIKVLTRQKARELRIPVVMDTSDRGMIDVERFDLEPERPLLHGALAHLDPAQALLARTNEEKLPFIVHFAGLDTLSTRMKASAMEIGHTISTWPQLGSSVQLGGAVVSDVVRRIALGQFQASGRWYIDLEDLLAAPRTFADERAEMAATTDRSANGVEDLLLRASSAPDRQRIDLTLAEARLLAEAGALAPSADNMQPWQFLFDKGRLFLFHDPSRSRSQLDTTGFIPHLALGMCLENILLCAGTAGLAVEHSLCPVENDPGLIAVIDRVTDKAPEPSDLELALSNAIGMRHTNRQKGNGAALDPKVLDRIRKAVQGIPGAQVHFITAPEQLDELAGLCGAADRLRVMNEHGHREFFTQQLRWTREEAERLRDGLDVATLELSGSGRVGLRMASSPLAMRALVSMGGGRALEKISSDAVRSSAAVALITMPGEGHRQRLVAGCAAERLWLEATRSGTAVHPISAPIFLAHHARFSGGTGFSPSERTEVLNLFDRLMALFSSRGEDEPFFMVRLSKADPASARSLRRPLDELFHVPVTPQPVHSWT